MEFSIQGRRIGSGHPPFIIAEMSGNHNQSLTRALTMVDHAAACGVDALKIQTYKPETMTLSSTRPDFVIKDEQSQWDGKKLYDLYEEAKTPWEWHEKVFSRCREAGIIGFSTPFDESAVDFLEACHVPLYKISSFENTDLSLIEKVVKTGKPVIISTGMASLSEVEDMVKTVRDSGGSQFVLLKCTSTYPAPPAHSNISTIPHMAQTFSCPVGLSDHTLGIGAAVGSVALGASVIEKHFVLDRSEGGVDASFSLEPSEMKQLVQESKNVWQAMGRISYGDTPEDERARNYRRSLYISKDVKKGETFTDENIRAVRPGYGLLPKYKSVFLGKRAPFAISKGTPLSWNMLTGRRNDV
ncbi:pseudaminic acid synthase [Halobacillus kuroshimensis]|uniref:Pseudaminic acid synthase n=1 Tax=Halobacillus kuroshimensis TaxID=302481 RepID=A0ABS3DWL5_9BACI|nr:pseudaminic acid synthase [Halobacillus kuroshimensis]MBN8235729.1 pseudaminic acid synthase [Halobacillus kuroshimensis]